MKRLGKFSGKIYDEQYETRDIKECCQIITDEQAGDEKWVEERHLEHLKTCVTCFQCPLSKPDGRTILREFNDIGEKITIQLRYQDFEVTKLPEDCSRCPVGFMYQGCGREVPLTVGGRPDTCKLKLIKLFETKEE